MGVVYLAHDLKLDQDIALKRIRPDRVSPERRETLRREIILSRKVTHENVCRVFDLVKSNGEEFVSMEYLPGRTLKDVEDEGRCCLSAAASRSRRRSAGGSRRPTASASCTGTSSPRTSSSASTARRG